MAPRSRQSHRPFKVLEDMVADGELSLAPSTDKLIAPPKRVSDGVSDDEAFVSAMAEVTPLGWSDAPLNLPAPVQLPERSDAKSAMRELEEFVSGQRGEMDPFATGEGVEGARTRGGRKFLPRLKRGEFSVQDHLDLHGFDPDEAVSALGAFIRRSQHRGYTCVRVIHGRGKHSLSEPAAVKLAVTRWLSSKKMSRAVVAFSSATWKDGGGGAIYVLLYGRWRQR